MWFKQARCFEIKTPVGYDAQSLEEQLALYTYKSATPTMLSSQGWVAPTGADEAPLVHAGNGYMLICLQCEEKILPASVIRQQLEAKIKVIQAEEDRKVRQAEKQALREDITFHLLPQAFSKLTPLFAYIDTRHQRLIVNTSNKKKLDEFVAFFKQTTHVEIALYETRNMAKLMTDWLTLDTMPSHFSVTDACILQDPAKTSRVISAKQQNPYATPMQQFIKEGCEVTHLGLAWHDRVEFILSDEFILKSIRYSDELVTSSEEVNTETEVAAFDTDFIIMSQSIGEVFEALLPSVLKERQAMTTTEGATV